MGLNDNSVFLIACISETLGYGIALILFINATRTLLKKKKVNENLNLPIFIAAPVLFFFATLHIFGVWVRTYKAFVTYPQGPLAYWGLITSPEKTVTQVGQVGAVILGDLMTVYRTFVIWQLNPYIIIVPAMTFVATVVSAAGFITAQHKVNVHTSIFSTTVTRWTEAWLSCSLITTGICTFAIMYKLLSVQRSLGQSIAYNPSRSLTTRVLRIFVESAALYSTNNLLYAVLYSTKILEEAWFSGLAVPIASITFSLIIIRVESAVNSPPTTRQFKTRTTGGSSSSNDPDYSAFDARKGVQRTYPSLIASNDLEEGVNEIQLKPVSLGGSGPGANQGKFNPYSAGNPNHMGEHDVVTRSDL